MEPEKCGGSSGAPGRERWPCLLQNMGCGAFQGSRRHLVHRTLGWEQSHQWAGNCSSARALVSLLERSSALVTSRSDGLDLGSPGGQLPWHGGPLCPSLWARAPCGLRCLWTGSAVDMWAAEPVCATFPAFGGLAVLSTPCSPHPQCSLSCSAPVEGRTF